MKHVTLFLSLIIIPVVISFGQSSVVMSALTVADIGDPTANEVNSFLIEVTATDPGNLSMLEIVLEDHSETGRSNTVNVPVVNDNGKVKLKFENYSVPAEGKHLKFFLTVRGQLAAPYHRILLRGFDRANQPTNQVVFNRIN